MVSQHLVTGIAHRALHPLISSYLQLGTIWQQKIFIQKQAWSICFLEQQQSQKNLPVYIVLYLRQMSILDQQLFLILRALFYTLQHMVRVKFSIFSVYLHHSTQYLLKQFQMLLLLEPRFHYLYLTVS